MIQLNRGSGLDCRRAEVGSVESFSNDYFVCKTRAGEYIVMNRLTSRNCLRVDLPTRVCTAPEHTDGDTVRVHQQYRHAVQQQHRISRTGSLQHKRLFLDHFYLASYRPYACTPTYLHQGRGAILAPEERCSLDGASILQELYQELVKCT